MNEENFKKGIEDAEDSPTVSLNEARVRWELQKKNFDIPDAHEKMVMDRFTKVRKNPDRLLDWDEVKEGLMD